METKNVIKASVDFNAESAESGASSPKFRIVANAGSRMEFWSGSVVIDMEGEFKARKTPLPIVYAHNLNEPIGVANKIEVADGKLILEGEILASSDRANLFVETSKKGLKWEASIGFNIVGFENVKRGEKATVNGREESGPLTIARKIEMWECSVVLYGADNKTESVVTAGANMENEQNSPDNAAENNETDFKSGVDIQAELEALRKARSEENARIDAIEKIAKDYGSREFVAKAIDEGWSAERFELETLRKARSAVPFVQVADSSIDSKAIEVAFVRAAGVPVDEQKYGDKVLSQADKLAGLGFRDLIEAGTGFSPTRAQMRDGRDWLDGVCRYTAGAVTTHSLQSLLSNSANAVMLGSFNYYPSTWRECAKIGSVNDYKALERWRMSSDFGFKQRLRGGEYEQVKWSDESWKIQAYEYGIQGSIDAQDIVNGEALNVFSDTMRLIGIGAAKTINKKFWDLFLTPPQVSSTNFYSTNFETLKASCALNFENLSAARVAFIKKKIGNATDTAKAKNVQKDEYLGLAPAICIVPTTLEDTAKILMNGSWLNNGSTSNNIADVNPNKGRYKIISSPECEVNSSSSWYLMTDPNVLAAFEIVFLRGQQTPTLRSSEIEIGSRGVKFEGSMSYGVGTFDYRAIQKMTA